MPVPAPAWTWTRPSHRGGRRGARSRPRRPRGAPPPRAAGWGTPAACTRWAPPGRRRRRRGGTPAIDHGRAGRRRRVCHPLRRSPAARAAVGGGPTPPRPRVARWAVGRPLRAAHPAGRPRAGRRRAGASQVGRPRGRPHWVCFCLASRPTRACTCVCDTSVGRSVGRSGRVGGSHLPVLVAPACWPPLCLCDRRCRSRGCSHGYHRRWGGGAYGVADTPTVRPRPALLRPRQPQRGGERGL